MIYQFAVAMVGADEADEFGVLDSLELLCKPGHVLSPHSSCGSHLTMLVLTKGMAHVCRWLRMERQWDFNVPLDSGSTPLRTLCESDLPLTSATKDAMEEVIRYGGASTAGVDESWFETSRIVKKRDLDHWHAQYRRWQARTAVVMWRQCVQTGQAETSGSSEGINAPAPAPSPAPAAAAAGADAATEAAAATTAVAAGDDAHGSTDCATTSAGGLPDPRLAD